MPSLTLIRGASGPTTTRKATRAHAGVLVAMNEYSTNWNEEFTLSADLLSANNLHTSNDLTHAKH